LTTTFWRRSSTRIACHAISIGERRPQFPATLLNLPNPPDLGQSVIAP